MTRASIVAAILVVALGCGEPGSPSSPAREEVARGSIGLPDLPRPVSNNAVARTTGDDGVTLYSFMGIGQRKQWDDITNEAWRLPPGDDAWRAIPPVPGAGRIAAAAVGVRNRVFVIGGYTVAADHSEVSVPNVDIFDVRTGAWSRGADVPVPVDDSVAGAYRGRWIVMVSGWSQKDNVPDVQIYDVDRDEWSSGTPIPGTPVFGHAGAVAGDVIVYVDGAHRNAPGERPSYLPSDECWLGRIAPGDPTRIDWVRIPGHPGAARYRMAAAASEDGSRILFTGGTDNPYNYDGVGYDGRLSEPAPGTFAWDVAGNRWVAAGREEARATMDHRGLLEIGGRFVRIGGMETGARVTARIGLCVGCNELVTSTADPKSGGTR